MSALKCCKFLVNSVHGLSVWLRLPLPHLAVMAPAGEQILMCASFHNRSLVEDQDLVDLGDGRKSVSGDVKRCVNHKNSRSSNTSGNKSYLRDDYSCPPFSYLLQRLLHLSLCL